MMCLEHRDYGGGKCEKGMLQIRSKGPTKMGAPIFVLFLSERKITEVRTFSAMF